MLLCKLACKTVLLSPHIAIWVRDELEAMVEEEERNLISVQSAGCAVEICFALQPSAEAMMRALGTQSQKSENQEIIVQKNATDETAPHDESRKDQHQIRFEKAPSSSTPLDGDGPASELPDVGPMTECPSCAVCNYECYLSAVECTLPDGSISYLCLLHGVSSEHEGAAVREATALRTMRLRHDADTCSLTATNREEEASCLSPRGLVALLTPSRRRQC